MIVFAIVKEPYGWAVRRDDCMMMPAACRDAAISAAERMVRALSNQGERAVLHFEGAGAHAAKADHSPGRTLDCTVDSGGMSTRLTG